MYNETSSPHRPFSQALAVWAGGRLPGRRAGAVQCNAAAALPGGLVQALPSRPRLHSFFSIVSYTRAAPARRRYVAAAAERIKHTMLSQRSYSSSYWLRRGRWQPLHSGSGTGGGTPRHAAAAAATVLPPPTAPPRTLFKNGVYYFFQRLVSSRVQSRFSDIKFNDNLWFRK